MMGAFSTGDPVFGGQIFSTPDPEEPPFGTGDSMLYEDGTAMLYEDGTIMLYE